MNAQDLDGLLSQTLPPRNHPKPHTRAARRQTPAIIASWSKSGRIRRWAASPVAAYRLGLMIGYWAMMLVGGSAITFGIPVFDRTTPDGWTPIWGTIVIISGLVAAVGSLRAGTSVEEGKSLKEVKLFNYIEMAGAIGLFLTLGTLAALLLILAYGYGYSEDATRGAAFVALGVQPAVRLLWLLFSPPKSLAQRNTQLRANTGPTPTLKSGE